MINVALAVLALAMVGFMVRLYLGPSVPDRVVALDGLLTTVMCGILVASVRRGSSISLDTALIVALVGFIGTGVLARYVEKRGG